MLRYGYLLLHLHTHVMLRYGYLGVGLGGVGWGNNVHVNLPKHVMLRYGYLLLHLHTLVILGWGWVMLRLLLSWGGVGWGGVGQKRSCQLAHTRHATLWLSSLALAHTRHATLRWSSLAFAHTRHATSCLFLQMETVLGSHMPKVWKSNMAKCLIKTRNGPNKCEEPPSFSCPLWQGRKSLTDGGKAWKIIFPKAFQDGCIMESTQKGTLNWKSLSWVTVGENLWDHWHLTDFSKNFARPSKQWRASEKKEKSAASQKNTNLCQKTK